MPCTTALFPALCNIDLRPALRPRWLGTAADLAALALGAAGLFVLFLGWNLGAVWLFSVLASAKLAVPVWTAVCIVAGAGGLYALWRLLK